MCLIWTGDGIITSKTYFGCNLDKMVMWPEDDFAGFSPSIQLDVSAKDWKPNKSNIKPSFPLKKLASFGIMVGFSGCSWHDLGFATARLRPKKMPISSTQKIRDRQPTNTNHQKISYIHLKFMLKYKLLIKYICSICVIYYVTSLSVTSHVRWLKLKDDKNPIID